MMVKIRKLLVFGMARSDDDDTKEKERGEGTTF